MAPNRPVTRRARAAKGALTKSEGTSGARGSRAGKPLVLGPELRIGTATQTFSALSGAVRDAGATLELDAGNVEKADSAGVQALVAGVLLARSAGKALAWKGCSTPLKAAAELLGVAAVLELPQ